MDVAKQDTWQRTKNVLKNNKNNKDKKKTTAQIYMAREDKSEESEPYRGSQYNSEGEEVGFENESQDEEKVQMHTYRTEEFKEDFEEIEELDKED